MYPRFAFTLLFSFAAIGLGIAIPAFPVDERCGANAEYLECGSACAPTCENPNPGPACTLQCVIGCFCKEGYLKNAQGQCVRPHECDGQTHPTIPMQIPAAAFPTCPDNEEFQACGSACAPTCANPNPSPMCTKNCVVGCFCKQGHLRNGKGVCVPAHQCEASQPSFIQAPVKQCKENEIFLACGSACAPTCANPNPGPACTLQCVTGCFCKPGYLKNSQGVCVPAIQCDTQSCGDNEEFRACKGCDGTCDNPNPPCPRICIPGCACKEGHLRTGQNGKCVPVHQCEASKPSFLQAPMKQCKENEIFLACGSACAPTCANPNPGPVCTLQCVTGCFCKPGFLKNSQGVCVPAIQCDSQSCGDNEEFRACKGCDGTCDNPNPLCPRICIPGCACKEGHLRTGQNGKCIPKAQCTAAPTQCPQNEVFRTCGTACPATCANPHPSPVCTKNCVIGCFCQEGHLRNGKGACVPAANCEAPQPLVAMLKTEPKCPTDREYYAEGCGNQLDCMASCHTPPVFLIRGVPQIPAKCLVRMCKPTCVCKHPYVRNEQGQCVERSECDQLTTHVPVTH